MSPGCLDPAGAQPAVCKDLPPAVSGAPLPPTLVPGSGGAHPSGDSSVCQGRWVPSQHLPLDACGHLCSAWRFPSEL